MKNEKNRKKWNNREKTQKKEKTGINRKKNGKLQEIQKRDFDKVPGNAENGNVFGNEFEVFSNVTKRRFEGKNDTSSHSYTAPQFTLHTAHCTLHNAHYTLQG